MLDQIKQALKKRIEKDIGRAFEELEKILSPQSAHQGTFGTLYNRFNSLKIDEIEGTASYENMKMTENQITKGLLSLIDFLSEDDLHPEQLLQFQIENINLEEDLGEVHLVNCNRDTQDTLFWNSFESFSKTPYQFYFINACNTQMPQSLAERVIYELIELVLDNDDEALNLVIEEKSNRVQVENLPLGPTFQFSKKKFETYFCERFEREFGQANQLSFAEFLQTGLPKLKQQYVATVFQVNKWKPSLMKEYFQWIMSSFTSAHEDVPTFLFFFPVMLKGFVSEEVPAEHVEAVKIIHELCAEYSSSSIYIEPLPPVKKADIDIWLANLGVGNPVIRDRIIHSLINTLLPERQQQIAALLNELEKIPDLSERRRKMAESIKLDMAEAEILQEKIYEFSQR